MYLTIENLTSGADFGAQMMVVAGLYSVSKKTGHKLALTTNRDDQGYRLKIKDQWFKNFYTNFDKIDYTSYNWEHRGIRQDIFVDETVYDLDPTINYNFPVNFSTYHYWQGLENEIKHIYEFQDDINQQCLDFVNAIKGNRKDKEIVAVHFRRGDYLHLSSLKLSLDYYYEAVKYFDPNKHILLLFSNNEQEVDWCINNFKPERFEIHATDHKYPNRLDMCVMSHCDHVIMANSSYSWWGAFLNKNVNKQIICPYNYLNVPHLNYINGNYYPKEWTALNQI